MGKYSQQIAAVGGGTKSKYADQIAQFSGAVDTPLIDQAPGVIERAGEGAIRGMIPGVSTYEAIRGGGSGYDIGGALAGDVGQLAATGAQFMTGGLPLVAKNVGLGGVLGGLSGAAAPALQAAGEYGRKAAGYSPAGLLAKLIPKNTQSQVGQFVKEIPGTIGETVGQVGPVALLTLLTGKNPQAILGDAKKSGALEALKAYGGQETPAMTGGAIPKALETSARLNPLTAGRFEKIDAANAQAASEFAKAMFGQDIGGPNVRAGAGVNAQQLLANLADRRAQAYKPAAEALKSTSGNIARGMRQAVEGVAATESISNTNRNAFLKSFAAEMAGRKTAADVDKAMTAVKDRFKQELGGAPLSGQINRDFQLMMNAAKDKFYENLGPIGEEVRAMKGDYAQATKEMTPLAEILSKRTNDPENVMEAIIKSGRKGVGDMMQAMTPDEITAFRRDVSRTILDLAKGKDGISGEKLQTLLTANKQFRDVLPVIFGSEKTALNDLAEAMRIAKSPELGVVNPSGTSRAGAAGLTTALLGGSAYSPLALKTLLGKTAIDLGYTYGYPAMQKGVGAIMGSRPQIPQMVPGANNLQNAILQAISASR